MLKNYAKIIRNKPDIQYIQSSSIENDYKPLIHTDTILKNSFEHSQTYPSHFKGVLRSLYRIRIRHLNTNIPCFGISVLKQRVQREF